MVARLTQHAFAGCHSSGRIARLAEACLCGGRVLGASMVLIGAIVWGQGLHMIASVSHVQQCRWQAQQQLRG